MLPLEPIYLFVYGSLKKGFPLSYALHSTDTGLNRYISLGRTKKLFSLYTRKNFSFPYLVRDRKGAHIEGEIWEIDEAKLRHLDQIEGHPHHFTRCAIHIEGIDEVIQTYLYQHDTDDLLKLDLSSWPLNAYRLSEDLSKPSYRSAPSSPR